jgi:hypothetical protein
MIKKCFLILALIGLSFAFAISCNAQVKAVENLVVNPDFEDGIVAPWTTWVEDGAAVMTKSIDKNEKLTGDLSLLIDIQKKGGGMRVELHQNPFVLKANQKMIYAFWAKVSKDEVRPASMNVNHRADPWTGYGSKAITITDEWTEFWLEANITANDSLVGIYVELRDTVGKTWFDHFRFYEGKYIQEELGKEVKKAVDPSSKMAATWATIKANAR